MADLAARGYTGVLHTFSENDFAYYRDTMAEIVAISHAAGLAVQASPWGLGRTFGGEAESRWVAFHPAECQVLDDGRHVAAACLNSQAYRDFCKEWADWVLECGVDSVFWDEPAWVVPVHVGIDDAARWTCRCDNCVERFGGPIPAERTPEVQAFREASVVGFLREMLAHVAERGGLNAICLLPSTEGTQGLADWNEVASLPGLATLVTDPYWKHWDGSAEEFVRRFARLLRETADRHGVGAQLWVPSFGLTRDDIPDLEAAIAATRDEGVEDIWTWGYEACGHMTSLATPDSPLVWEAVSAALTGRPQVATTETARPELADLDLRSTRDLVRLLNEEDATVPAAVAEAGDDARRRDRRDRRAYAAAAGGSSTRAPARRAPSLRSTLPSAAPRSARPWRGPRRRRRPGRGRGRSCGGDERIARALPPARGLRRRRQREWLDPVRARRARGRARGGRAWRRRSRACATAGAAALAEHERGGRGRAGGASPARRASRPAPRRSSSSTRSRR